VGQILEAIEYQDSEHFFADIPLANEKEAVELAWCKKIPRIPRGVLNCAAISILSYSL